MDRETAVSLGVESVERSKRSGRARRRRRTPGRRGLISEAARGIRLEAVFAVAGFLAIAVLATATVAEWRHYRRSAPKAAGSSAGTAALPTTSTRVRQAAPRTSGTVKRSTVELVASRGECWVSIHRGSARGPVLFEGTLVQGKRFRAAGTRLWIRLGAPETIDVTLNGRAVRDVLSGTGSFLVADGKAKAVEHG